MKLPDKREVEGQIGGKLLAANPEMDARGRTAMLLTRAQDSVTTTVVHDTREQ
jgi:hypothetical protein